MRKIAGSLGLTVLGSLSLLLSACASVPNAPPAPQIVQVPVPVPCVASNFPKRPNFTDTPTALLNAPDGASLDALVYGNWFMHQAWEAALEKQLSICSRVH